MNGFPHWTDDPDLTSEDKRKIHAAMKAELGFIIMEWKEERAEMVESITSLAKSVGTLESIIKERGKAVDKLVETVDTLNKVLTAGKGTLEILFLAAKVVGALSVIGGAWLYFTGRITLK